MIFLLFLAFLFLLLFVSSREGFELGKSPIGQYDYLKPPPGPAILSAEVENNFMEAYNKNAVSIFTEAVLDKDKINNFKKYITVAEVEYYVKNDKWPYCSSLMYCLENKKDAIEKLPIKKLDDIQKIWPTRLIFLLVCNGECSKSPPSLDCDIYSGKHKG